MKIYLTNNNEHDSFFIINFDNDKEYYCIDASPIFHCDYVFPETFIDSWAYHNRYYELDNPEAVDLIYKNLVNITKNFAWGNYSVQGNIIKLMPGKHNLPVIRFREKKHIYGTGIKNADKLLKMCEIIKNILNSV